MKKNKGNKGIKILAVLAVIVGGSFVVMKATSGSALPVVGYTELYPADLVNSVNVKGTVESVEKRNVYTTLGFIIKNVDVEVGDRVTEGQVLCVLDTADLELNIAQQKADLEVTRQNSANSLQNNQRIYNEATSNLTNGTNSQVLNAESSLKSAETNLANAQKNYDDAMKDYLEGTNSQVVNAESSVTSTKMDLDTKTNTYENNKILYSVGALSKEAFTQSEDAFINSQNKYNDALISLENAKTSQKRSLEQLESTLQSAVTSRDNALAALNTAKIASQQDLEKYKNNITSSQISANTEYKEIAIQKLEKQLADSMIKAPISGTITAVYAKEGATGSGLLFVIENTDNLKVTTKLKEYDASMVNQGMDVTIKSDATGDAVYTGKLSKINPAAVKNANGDTASASDVEFAAEVTVTSKGTGLRIGMNARLNVIMEKKEGVYRVPYDAVMTDNNGSYILVIDTNDQNQYIAAQIPVNTGMETDFYVEITGELRDGLKVINDASSVQPGMQLTYK